MRKHFKHSCRRRSGESKPAKPAFIGQNPGAGSGGGPVQIEEIEIGPEAGGHSRYFDGTYAIAANRIEFASRPSIPPTIPTDFVISLLAGGMGIDGRIEAHGSQGVRVTAGPPEMPPATSEGTNGVEVIVGELQNITIQRGLIEEVDQQILMQPGSILVDGGVGTVTIQSMTEVKLQVADGLSSITLTPAGIIIQGLLVSIN